MRNIVGISTIVVQLTIMVRLFLGGTARITLVSGVQLLCIMFAPKSCRNFVPASIKCLRYAATEFSSELSGKGALRTNCGIAQ